MAKNRRRLLVASKIENVLKPSFLMDCSTESTFPAPLTRATSVVRYLIGQSVGKGRLSAAGYSDLHPTSSNSSAYGRSRNRRVEIVLQRTNNTGDTGSDPAAPDAPSFPEPSFP